MTARQQACTAPSKGGQPSAAVVCVLPGGSFPPAAAQQPCRSINPNRFCHRRSLQALEGVKMELIDAAYPLLAGGCCGRGVAQGRWQQTGSCSAGE